MSNRFGRNQRRALRAELAAERSARLVGTVAAPAGTVQVDQWGVVAWSLGIECDTRAIARTASVLVENGTQAVRARHADASVSFQGALYRIVDLRFPSRSGGGFFGSTYWQGGPDAFWLDLVGVDR